MESLHTKTLVHLLSRLLDVIQDHVRSAEVEIEEMQDVLRRIEDDEEA